MVAESTGLQKYISLNSTEAEYVALSKAAKTGLWLRRVCTELGLEKISPRISQYNNGFIELANGRAMRHLNKRKDITIKRNDEMSMLEENVVRLAPVRTTKLEADYLTKPLAPKELKTELNAVDIFIDK